jgi:WS/DGAT/MGAT family acyltransferase
MLMAERVQGMDAAFLEMESPTMHLHVVGVLVLDPSTAGVELSAERLASLFAERLHLIPPFRRRVVEVPGGLDHPRWIEDPDFDLGRHIFHRYLGPDAGREALERFVGELSSAPLRRDAPLWETWLADGFADGTVALVSKVHHAMMDGSAGGDLMASLFDLEPEPAPVVDAPEWEGEQPPAPRRLLAAAGPAAVGRVARVPGALMHTVVSLAGSARAVAAAPESVAAFAPASAFNGPLTATRSVAFSHCALEDLKEVRRLLGSTVNDVVLAATALAMRRYLLARGIEPAEPLVASVPVDGRREGEEFGNHTSNMMMPLPVQLDDPVAVVRAIHDGAVAAKAAQDAIDSHILDEWISLMPAGLLTAGAALYSSMGLGRLHPPLFNTIVSNMPGPPIPLYLAGARLVAAYPMGPLIGNTGLNVTVLSYDGALNVGVIACPELIDDVGELANGFVLAVADLLEAATAVASGSSTPSDPLGPVGPAGPTPSGDAEPDPKKKGSKKKDSKKKKDPKKKKEKGSG